MEACSPRAERVFQHVHVRAKPNPLPAPGACRTIRTGNVVRTSFSLHLTVLRSLHESKP